MLKFLYGCFLYLSKPRSCYPIHKFFAEAPCMVYCYLKKITVAIFEIVNFVEQSLNIGGFEICFVCYINLTIIFGVFQKNLLRWYYWSQAATTNGGFDFLLVETVLPFSLNSELFNAKISVLPIFSFQEKL